MRTLEEEFHTSAAREAIAGAVVGIHPVQRAIGLNFLPGRYTNGIVAIELSLHARGRHDRLPDALALLTGRRTFRFGIGGAHRQEEYRQGEHTTRKQFRL